MGLSRRQQRKVRELRELAAAVQAKGIEGVAAEVDALLDEGAAGLAAGEQLLAHVLQSARAWAQAPAERRSEEAARLHAATAGARRVQAEAALERAATAAAEHLQRGAREQGRRLSQAMARELQAHPAPLLRAELSGFLCDRFALFAQRAATIACEALRPQVGALRAAHLERVPSRPGAAADAATNALHLLHGELGLLVEDAREMAEAIMRERLEGSALTDGLAGLGESRFKRKLARELPECARAAGEQLASRLSDRLLARVARLAAEIDRHSAAHQRMALGFLSSSIQLSAECADDLLRQLGVETTG